MISFAGGEATKMRFQAICWAKSWAKRKRVSDVKLLKPLLFLLPLLRGK